MAGVNGTSQAHNSAQRLIRLMRVNMQGTLVHTCRNRVSFARSTASGLHHYTIVSKWRREAVSCMHQYHHALHV